MPTYNFQEVIASQKLVFTCVSCGKPKRTKTIRVMNTVNPWNRHADGTPRTHAEIQDKVCREVAVSADLFMKYPVCAACKTDNKGMH